MENGSPGYEQKRLIDELISGRRFARQLGVNLDPSSSIELQESLVEKIVSSFDTALLLLKWNDSDSEQLHASPNNPGIDLPDSGSISPRSENSGRVFKDQDHREISKKRKILPKWKKQVHVNMESGLEVPMDDGFNWRKYGQKDILGAKFPRGYYRCTHRAIQGCFATKQVQRSDTNPLVFDVTYHGKHTCSQTYYPMKTSSDNKKPPPQQHQHQHQHQHQQIVLNFKTGLKVKTKYLEDPELNSSFSFPSTPTENAENGIFPPATGLDNLLIGGFSPSFISPTTSESNYFSLSPVNCYGGGPNLQTLETDLSDIISSATSMPMVNLDLILEPVEFQSFPFDNSDIFT